MKKSFVIGFGLFIMGLGSSVFAQVKTQEPSAKKVENRQIAHPLSTPHPAGNASSSQTSKTISGQPMNAAGSARSQMPSVKVGDSKIYEGGSKAQPNRSSGVPSDKGRIVPREKLIEGK